ncbi:hypothetical protein E4U33_002835 [Claviceps sp. LM78 group G4]|nr:hypothetical protein E4U33_002835 [Claviceps sp. LM78 group G4]
MLASQLKRFPEPMPIGLGRVSGYNRGRLKLELPNSEAARRSGQRDSESSTIKSSGLKGQVVEEPVTDMASNQ